MSDSALAAELGILDNEVELNFANVTAGTVFVSQKNMIYRLNKWIEHNDETGRAELYIWPSGDVEDVLNAPEPDGELCVRKETAMPIGERVWILEGVEVEDNSEPEPEADEAPETEDEEDVVEEEPTDESGIGATVEAILVFKGPMAQLADILKKIEG